MLQMDDGAIVTARLSGLPDGLAFRLDSKHERFKPMNKKCAFGALRLKERGRESSRAPRPHALKNKFSSSGLGQNVPLHIL